MLAIFMATVMVLSSCCIFVCAPLSEDTYGATESNGKLIVETSPYFAPYDYIYGTEYAGIDMDILHRVGEIINYEIEFRNNSFDSIILSVQQKKCNFGASGFTINDERKQMIDFSKPYATIHQVVVAQKGADITSEDDVKGKKISVQTGTSGADYATTLTSDVIYQKGYSEVVLDVLYGKAFCEVVDDAVAYAQVAAHPDELEVFNVLNAPREDYGFVFNKDDAALRNLVNSALDQMTADGTLQKIHDYYADNNFAGDTPPYYTNDKIMFGVTGDNGSHAYAIDGGLAGISVDMLNAIAKDAGYGFRTINSSADLIPEKVAGNDRYVGAFGYNVDYDVTEKGVVMSDAYFVDTPLIVTKYSVAISSEDDLRGKKVGIVEGNEKLSAYLGDLGALITPYKSASAAMDAINSGDLDYAAIDKTVASSILTRGLTGLSLADILTDAPKSEIGFLIPEGSEEMLAAINTSIAKLKEDGTLDEIAEYYADNGYSVEAHSFFYDDSELSWWDKFVQRLETNFINNDRYEYIITGFGNTIKITILALVIGLVIGLLVAAVLSLNAQTGKGRIPAAICRLYVTIIRGTPAMVQLLLIYYVVFASASLNPVLVASVAFGINSGAYITEIFRSGINSVPKGQMEAARCLGLNTATSMKSVVVPQALRNILPALGNESISLLKETSIAGYIGVIDLTRAADIIRGQTYDALVPLIAVAIIYLAIVLVLQFLIKKLERRLNNAY